MFTVQFIRSWYLFRHLPKQFPVVQNALCISISQVGVLLLVNCRKAPSIEGPGELRVGEFPRK